MAYKVSKLDRSLLEWYTKADEIYTQFCIELDVDKEEVFDADAHRAKRIAEQHQDYI
jgi:hypothetical protein